MDHLQLKYLFAAPPDLVFDAWVKEFLMHKWLFVGPTSEIVMTNIDVRPGGKFSMLEFDKSKNEYIDHFGTYLEILPPKKLVFTLSVPRHFAGETTVSVEINAKAAGSELILTQKNVAKEVTEASWKMMLEQLRLTLENH